MASLGVTLGTPIRVRGRAGLWMIPGSFIVISLVLVLGGGAALYQRFGSPRVRVTIEDCYPGDSCVGTWTLNGKPSEGVIDHAGEHQKGDIITASILGGNGDTMRGYMPGGIAMIVVGLLCLLYLPFWFRKQRATYVANGMSL